MHPKKLNEETIQIINKVIRNLYKTFVFSYFDAEDIQQECWVEVMKALEEYDGVRPLENFLCVHLRNRLLNLWRDRFRRVPSPCPDCHDTYIYGVPQKHPRCEKYTAWLKLNDVAYRANYPLNIAVVSEHSAGSNAIVTAAGNELRNRIDEVIPARLRTTYLKMLAGEKVKPALREEVELLLREAFPEYETQN